LGAGTAADGGGRSLVPPCAEVGAGAALAHNIFSNQTNNL